MPATAPLRFRSDYFEVLKGELIRLRAREVGGALELKPLSPPHPRSPFLCLAEHQGAEELPTRVLKVLMLPESHEGAHRWIKILGEECERLNQEFRDRLTPGEKLGVLRLPLTTRREGQGDPVDVRALRSLRWGDLIEGEPESARQHPVLHYMVRPYIPWPTLQESGLPRYYLSAQWRKYCDDCDLPDKVRNDPLCRAHFFQEALANGTDDVLLVSAWRWQRLGRSTRTAAR